ncbi:ABC transporter ATP-binding protein [Crateriforma spongiae]|uniref:ABC transporter ATP-binding protein n=1 Tax=Crateriforma spongiae TaxID=2724528 RepID=UPI0014480A79|nr:ATP-binding cassette domain-containing protein [Crateriforma spongiae]
MTELIARKLRHVAPDTNRVLLDDLEIQVSGSDRIGLAGPSGSGKSTLLRSLAFLECRTIGSIDLDGTRIQQGDVPRYRRDVAYLAQRPGFVAGTVEDNLRLPFQFHAASQDHSANPEFDRSAAVDRLKAFGRSNAFLDQDVATLSGGERQIASLIRSMLINPRILLLDEPTSALDADATAVVENVMQDWLQASGDRAWVWISHDANQLNRIANRTWTMNEGKLR